MLVLKIAHPKVYILIMMLIFIKLCLFEVGVVAADNTLNSGNMCASQCTSLKVTNEINVCVNCYNTCKEG